MHTNAFCFGTEAKTYRDNSSCVLPWPVVQDCSGVGFVGEMRETHEGAGKMLIAAQKLQPEITTRTRPFCKGINYFVYFSPYIAPRLTENLPIKLISSVSLV